MSKLCNFILSFCLCALTFYAPTGSVPVDNDLKDNGYLGLATKTIPKSVIALNLRLIHHIGKEKAGDNVVFSALGAYSALMMLHLGAGNKTRDELDKVFHIKDDDIDHDKLHETFSLILEKLKSKAPTSPLEFPVPETAIANGFFIQQGRSINESFTQLLKKYYDANATSVDFQGHASEATNFINEWISNSTHERIQKFYTDPLPATTVSVLTNAWYFNGVWKDTFEKDQTKTEKFNTESGEIDVQMMRNQKMVPFSRSDSLMFETLELPYSGAEYIMAITMPYGNQTLKNLTEHVRSFDAREFDRNLKVIGVDYKIPKIKVSGKNSLVDALGLVEIFQHADLSRMSDEKIPISDVFQATDLEVNEQGTIATAATAVSSTRVLSPPVLAEKQFFVNRPYMMTIMHRPTHTILLHCNVYKPNY